jgi:hypothetical protein
VAILVEDADDDVWGADEFDSSEFGGVNSKN